MGPIRLTSQGCIDCQDDEAVIKSRGAPCPTSAERERIKEIEGGDGLL